MKRGQLRNDTEYHLIRNIVVDLANSLADTQREELQRLLSKYESAAVRNMKQPTGMPALE